MNREGKKKASEKCRFQRIEMKSSARVEFQLETGRLPLFEGQNSTDYIEFPFPSSSFPLSSLLLLSSLLFSFHLFHPSDVVEGVKTSSLSDSKPKKKSMKKSMMMKRDEGDDVHEDGGNHLRHDER